MGIRGIPNAHGGFETFAEKLCPYLVEKGWVVTVYCQLEGEGDAFNEVWNGVNCRKIPVRGSGALSSVLFDFKCVVDSLRTNEPVLVLGYNTAVFQILQRLRGKKIFMNMDGIEWKRDKWGMLAKFWFWLNEFVGGLVSHELIADHPEISNHLTRTAFIKREKITTIPYGAPVIESADPNSVKEEGVEAGTYALIIARPEPENNILEIVQAFVRAQCDLDLLVLGDYKPEIAYHLSVLQAANHRVKFAGAIYDEAKVQSLRKHARCYLHGHSVGGTNPSLVEAMGAGAQIIAHDNKFNKWVGGEGLRYFKNSDECALLIQEVARESQTAPGVREMVKRHKVLFTWPRVLFQYEELIGGARHGYIETEQLAESANEESGVKPVRIGSKAAAKTKEEVL